MAVDRDQEGGEAAASAGRLAEPERLSRGHRHELPDARRAEPDRLSREIRAVSESPVVSAVLEAADAVLLVLNPERQIVGFNSRVADVEVPEDVLGRRPGEALGCVNARGRGGCGTSPACTCCGALGAIMACQERGRPVEAECLIRAERESGAAHEFNVRATPMTVDEARFTIVSFRDVSGEKRREALEQIFFHDVLNTVAGLRGWAEQLLRGARDPSKATARIDLLARRIEREIQDHRAILLAESGALVPERAPVRTRELLQDVAAVFANHPAARDRRLEIAERADDVELVTDRALVLRVLVNMVRNAFEATASGGAVGLRCERDGRAVRLLVSNPGAIAPDVQLHVFQRSFSTKAERGRGLGTYSMKLLGERYLGGEVSFTSSDTGGTTFSLRLPIRGA